MTNTLPIYHIDREAFWHDPYPDLKTLRHTAPVALVPELGAVLITRRDDIFQYEKMIEVFSSDQPDGLMNILMGQNMMRKDGPAHLAERRAIFPAMSPKPSKITGSNSLLTQPRKFWIHWHHAVRQTLCWITPCPYRRRR